MKFQDLEYAYSSHIFKNQHWITDFYDSFSEKTEVVH
ncbi:hypothetical protein IMCC3317_43120 [Kordia antarctica]|uniref:Uncharacterized protein n=1 Tax=Kordia antarctica TaxID=1218801 RepID=A0A7L4ZQN9_9FLAO|nr:hypothetical protein IMCC3317_43120 [Kordia antarctica]